MAGITFGSVGDIISVGELAWNIAKALNRTRGSANEYQSLTKELELFNKALLQVVTVWQNYANGPELVELGTITMDAIKDWRQELLNFQSKINKKYATNLCPAGSSNWFKDASKKIVWLKEKEDIVELRRRLHTFSDTVMLLSDVAQKKSDRLAEKDQAFRIQAVNHLLQESVKLAEKQISELKSINDKIDSQARISTVMMSYLRSGISSLTQVRTIVIEIRNSLVSIQNLIISQQYIARGIDFHWKQAPVIMELATGKQIPLPLELVNSWDMLDTILTEIFRQHPAQSKIKRKEFAIEQGSTGQEISRSLKLDLAFRPGEKVDMAMVFTDESTSNSCPRCQCSSTGSINDRAQCKECGMWFQRIVKVQQFDNFNSNSKDHPQFQPHAQHEEYNLVQPRKLNVTVLNPGDFKRVRLMQSPFELDPRVHQETELHIKFDQGINYVAERKCLFIDRMNIFREFLSLLTAYKNASMPLNNIYDQIEIHLQSKSYLAENFEQLLSIPPGTYASFDYEVIGVLEQYIQVAALKHSESGVTGFRNISKPLKNKPSQGDAVLVSFMDKGRKPEIALEAARQPLNPDPEPELRSMNISPPQIHTT